jgi:hypothetical protein
VARELPSEEQPMEISLWSGRKMNNKTNKWRRERFCLSVGKRF